MQRFARVILGYHGCVEPFASKLLTGEIAIADWPKSENRWDWLGTGIYFWEHAPERAWKWAQQKAARHGSDAKPMVIGAVIQVGLCFDLTDIAFTEMLAVAFRQVSEDFDAAAKPLPQNQGTDEDLRRRDLDCLIINSCLDFVAPLRFQTVRGAFWEGPRAYAGAMIRKESHLQLAVRDPSCILGVFRPNLRGEG